MAPTKLVSSGVLIKRIPNRVNVAAAKACDARLASISFFPSINRPINRFLGINPYSRPVSLDFISTPAQASTSRHQGYSENDLILDTEKQFSLAAIGSFINRLSRSQKQLLKLMVFLNKKTAISRFNNDPDIKKLGHLNLTGKITNAAALQRLLDHLEANTKGNKSISDYMNYTRECSHLDKNGIRATADAMASFFK
jgi:hypothetical protein